MQDFELNTDKCTLGMRRLDLGTSVTCEPICLSDTAPQIYEAPAVTNGISPGASTCCSSGVDTSGCGSSQSDISSRLGAPKPTLLRSSASVKPPVPAASLLPSRLP